MVVTPSPSSQVLHSSSSSPEVVLSTFSSSPPSRTRSPFRLPSPPPLDRIQRSLSGSPAPAGANSSLPNGAVWSLGTSAISRPSPVVPSHPASPSGSPLLSRPSSPRAGSGGQIADWNAARSESREHIFERDVEFNHLLQPREAVDVAVPSVLDGAALTLSQSLGEEDVNSIVRSTDAMGWESPGIGKGGFNFGSSTTSSRSPSVSRAMDHRHSGSPSRPVSGVGGVATELSPPLSPGGSARVMIGGGNEERDGVGNRSRSTSPGSASPARFGHSSPGLPSSPSASLQHRLADRSLSLLSIDSNDPKLHSLPAAFDPTSAFASSPTSHSGLNSPTVEQARKDAELSLSGLSLESLSFTSYADLVNEERLAELTGAAIGEDS